MSEVETSASHVDNQQHLMLKVLVLGNSKCGKTSLVKRYVDNTFTSGFKTTVSPNVLTFLIRTDWC